MGGNQFQIISLLFLLVKREYYHVPDIIIKESSVPDETSCIYLIICEFLNYFVYKGFSFVIIK